MEREVVLNTGHLPAATFTTELRGWRRLELCAIPSQLHRGL